MTDYVTCETEAAIVCHVAAILKPERRKELII
jgi:hypothetical protein